MDAAKKELVRQSKISLILDDYNDIFSDFDPRSYAERALSHDFLLEAKNAARDKELGMIELSFLVPRHLRNHGAEMVIKKRLRDHFKGHHDKLHAEMKLIRRKGIMFAIVGTIIGVGATFLAISDVSQIIKSACLILLEPASWFSIWSGLDHIFFYSQPIKNELVFYEKMTKAPVNFQDY
jgi:hypothetical protein